MGKKEDGNENAEIIPPVRENKPNSKTDSKIECITASFRTLNKLKDNLPIQNAVVYIWISHNNEEYNNDFKMMAVADLLPKIFDQSTCLMYQVNTGFLSRYNYLSEEHGKANKLQIADAEEKGRIEQKNWEGKREKNFSTLKLKKINWEDCIDSSKNPYFEDCRTIIIDKRKENTKFDGSFTKTVDAYANKHGVIKTNGDLYVTEETSWLLSLSLLHPKNQKIFIVHLSDSNEAIESLFKEFTLSTSMKLLSPSFGNTRTYKNLTEFKLEYRNNEHVGFSYAIENPNAKPELLPFPRVDFKKEKKVSMTSSLKNAGNMTVFFSSTGSDSVKKATESILKQINFIMDLCNLDENQREEVLTIVAENLNNAIYNHNQQQKILK